MNLIRTKIKSAFFFLLLSLLMACGTAYRTAERTITDIANSELWHIGRHGGLSEEETKWATVAWSYFENNYNPQTGFVNSIDRYPVASMWHVADYIAALYCARQLGFIDRKTFDERFSKLLHQLNTMPLAFDKLPNTLYNTHSGAMVDHANQEGEIGWSALDIGRLLFWLNIIKSDAKYFSEYIDRIVLRYDYCGVSDEDGNLFNGVKENNKLTLHRENSIGYTEYAKSGFRLWGMSVPPKLLWNPVHKVRIYDIDIDYDSSWARREGVYGPILTIPFALAGIEAHWKMPSSFGADGAHGNFMRRYAQKVYDIQEKRYEIEGISTARTDHPLSAPPYFLRDSIFGDGYAWSTLSDSGEHYPNLALVSTRAVFGMWPLWNTTYSDHLMDVIKELYDKQRGWFEGRYEQTARYDRTISISTNTVVLEAITYKKVGPFFDPPKNNTYAITKLSDKFDHPNGCLPTLG